MDLKKVGFPQESHAAGVGGNGMGTGLLPARGDLISQRESPHGYESLSDCLAGVTELREQWVGLLSCAYLLPSV